MPKPRPNIRKEGGGQGASAVRLRQGGLPSVTYATCIPPSGVASTDGVVAAALDLTATAGDGAGEEEAHQRTVGTSEKEASTVADAPAIPLRSALGLHLPFMLSLPWHRMKRGRCDALKCRARMHIHTHCTIRLRSTNATHRG